MREILQTINDFQNGLRIPMMIYTFTFTFLKKMLKTGLMATTVLGCKKDNAGLPKAPKGFHLSLSITLKNF